MAFWMPWANEILIIIIRDIICALARVCGLGGHEEELKCDVGG